MFSREAAFFSRNLNVSVSVSAANVSIRFLTAGRQRSTDLRQKAIPERD
jgi:hypothetical protein